MEPAKPRILFLVTTSDWGGAQHVVFEIAREARRRGSEVLVAAGSDGELETRCRDAGIPYRPLTKMQREISPLHDLAALGELRALIREWNPSVIHLNSTKMGLLGSLASRFTFHVSRPRIIYRIGGWAFLEAISPLKKRFYLACEQFAARWKDVIVTVHPGDEALARAHDIRPRGQVVMIPNGVDLDASDRTLLTQEDARTQLTVPPDATVIGSIANFYAPKNLPWFFAALAPLLRARPELRLVIIGDGPERTAVEKARDASGVRDQIILAGRKKDAGRFLRAFDVFVLPSSKEGMPTVLLEAMAARIPCIATDVGACRWMLGDAGIIVPPNDAERMTAAIFSLVDNPSKRTELGEAARHEAESRFRWDTTVEKTLQLF